LCVPVAVKHLDEIVATKLCRAFEDNSEVARITGRFTPRSLNTLTRHAGTQRKQGNSRKMGMTSTWMRLRLDVCSGSHGGPVRGNWGCVL
jgi:hypothetical protein